MSTKDEALKAGLQNGVKSLTRDMERKTLNESEKSDKVKSTKFGLRPDETRATFIVREETLNRLRAVVYWERTTIRETLEEMMSDYLNAYEAKTGKKIKPVPNQEGREPLVPKRVV
jgi:hypothetical protein